MSRLLLLACPINPKTLNPSGGVDIEFASPTEGFRWCLAGDKGQIEATGEGPVSGMPFADEALILMPTVDVRLIHTRLPLVSGKKLESLLPTLAEPFLIDQRTPLRYQALPPQKGANAIERTIVVTSASWMAWLESQLADLPVRSIRMIPDCFLMPMPEITSSAPTFLSNRTGNLTVIAVREGYDWGAGWIEAEAPNTAEDSRVFDWKWVVPNALTWIAQKTGINLILQATEKPKKQRLRKNVRWQPQVEWALWRKPLRLAAIGGAVYVAGSILYLAALAASNWRWDKVIQEAARQNLQNPTVMGSAVLPVYIQQATQKIHAAGKDTGGDFIPMAASLHTLLLAYPEGVLENLTYQAEGIRFRLRNMSASPAAEALVQRARDLNIAVIPLGRNEYQLLPYAGVTAALGREARP